MQKQKTDVYKQYLKVSLRFFERNVNSVQTYFIPKIPPSFMAIKNIPGLMLTGTFNKRPHVEAVCNSFLS